MNINYYGKRVLLILLFLFLFIPVLISKNIYSSTEKGFIKAIELYNKGLYTSAEAQLEKISQDYKPLFGINISEIELLLANVAF